MTFLWGSLVSCAAIVNRRRARLPVGSQVTITKLLTWPHEGRYLAL